MKIINKIYHTIIITLKIVIIITFIFMLGILSGIITYENSPITLSDFVNQKNIIYSSGREVHLSKVKCKIMHHIDRIGFTGEDENKTIKMKFTIFKSGYFNYKIENIDELDSWTIDDIRREMRVLKKTNFKKHNKEYIIYVRLVLNY